MKYFSISIEDGEVHNRVDNQAGVHRLAQPCRLVRSTTDHKRWYPYQTTAT